MRNLEKRMNLSLLLKPQCLTLMSCDWHKRQATEKSILQDSENFKTEFPGKKS